ncbi:hypothetical protein [Lysinibacillus capsici]|uniref:hypothetical protein n=1 Tax=Lysinibacillus capsici TaxID=2115968 RepID=UPI002480199D|nr:hypothetical protein [Lysinibacillus capsici]
MKTCVRLLLVFLILIPSLFHNVSLAYANSEEENSKKACEGALKDKETTDKVDDFRDDKATLTEEYSLDLVQLAFNAVNLNTLNQLIFGNPYCIWFESEEEEPALTYGLFPTSLKEKVIDPIFNIVTFIFTLILCLSILISGLKMMYSSTFSKRFNIGEELFMYFLAAILIITYWSSVDYIFMFNHAITSSVVQVLEAQGMKLGSLSLLASQDEFHFTDILVLFTEWVMLLFLNLVYMYRLFLITVLLIVGGLVIIGLLFEKTRKYFGLWLIDFLGAVFMQSVHAIYFAVIMMFINLNTLSIVFKMILLFLFLPLSSMLLSIMGMSAATMTTRTAQSMVNYAAKAIKSKQIFKGKPGLGKQQPSKTAISALAEGSGNWNKLKTGAQFTGAVMGSTAGMVIGPGGASLGASFGSSLMGSTLQAPRNIAAGVKGIMDTRGKVKDSSLNLNNISDKRQYFGSMGESLGTLVGQGQIGRKVGYRLSGISKGAILSSTELGGLGSVNLSDIAAKYPEAKIQFQQTNEGSGFYLDDNGDMKLISPIGEADTRLKDGMTRTVDYMPMDSITKIDVGNSLANSQMYSQVSDAMLTDNSGNTFVESGFDASPFRPEQHCNVGEMPSPIKPLETDSPFDSSISPEEGW